MGGPEQGLPVMREKRRWRNGWMMSSVWHSGRRSVALNPRRQCGVRSGSAFCGTSAKLDGGDACGFNAAPLEMGGVIC